MIALIFAITSAIAIISAIITVTAHNIVHALLYLVTMMLAVAFIFFLLGSPFAAALQIIVYAGAIMVLFVFVTMMLHQGEQSLSSERQLFSIKSAIGPLLLSGVLVIELLLISLNNIGLHTETIMMSITVKQLAVALFGLYQPLVILSAALLLAALISAIHITKRHQSSNYLPSKDAEHSSDITHNRGIANVSDRTNPHSEQDLTPLNTEPELDASSFSTGRKR